MPPHRHRAPDRPARPHHHRPAAYQRALCQAALAASRRRAQHQVACCWRQNQNLQQDDEELQLQKKNTKRHDWRLFLAEVGWQPAIDLASPCLTHSGSHESPIWALIVHSSPNVTSLSVRHKGPCCRLFAPTPFPSSCLTHSVWAAHQSDVCRWWRRRVVSLGAVVHLFHVRRAVLSCATHAQELLPAVGGAGTPSQTLIQHIPRCSRCWHPLWPDMRLPSACRCSPKGRTVCLRERSTTDGTLLSHPIFYPRQAHVSCLAFSFIPALCEDVMSGGPLLPAPICVCLFVAALVCPGAQLTHAGTCP